MLCGNFGSKFRPKFPKPCIDPASLPRAEFQKFCIKFKAEILQFCTGSASKSRSKFLKFCVKSAVHTLEFCAKSQFLYPRSGPHGVSAALLKQDLRGARILLSKSNLRGVRVSSRPKLVKLCGSALLSAPLPARICFFKFTNCEAARLNFFKFTGPKFLKSRASCKFKKFRTAQNVPRVGFCSPPSPLASQNSER